MARNWAGAPSTSTSPALPKNGPAAGGEGAVGVAAVIVADRVEAVGEIVTKLGTSPGARQRGAEEPTPVFLALLLVFGPGMCTRNAARVGESFGASRRAGQPALRLRGKVASLPSNGLTAGRFRWLQSVVRLVKGLRFRLAIPWRNLKPYSAHGGSPDRPGLLCIVELAQESATHEGHYAS